MPLKVVPQRDRKLNRLIKKGEVRTLRRTEILYEPEQAAHHVFLVKRGHLRLTQADPGGRGTSCVGLVGPWELAGEEALLPGARRRAWCRAGEPSRVVPLDGETVNRVLHTAARTLEAFLAAKEAELELCRRLAGLRRPRGAPRRLGALLIHLAERLGRREGEGVLLSVPLTHKLLAELASCHRSTVTTVLNDWIYRGHIRDEADGLRILAPEELLASRPSSVDPDSS